jgi:Transglutaminase-like superfamily
MPRERRGALLRASVAVVGFRVALSTLPFRWVRSIGERTARPRRGPRGRRGRDDLSWAVAAASRRVPRATCLTQALALQTLLAREGYESDLHIGVARSGDGGLEAHAWLESDGRIVIGGGGVERFTPLASLGLSPR